eukprot:GEZU01012998.1.p2 GENE.GEZU01012998.1~~GEZU01012998.1.p2  ORF type:complete len:113 (-),score=8.48 GEZU01012998.1:88-426(-)
MAQALLTLYVLLLTSKLANQMQQQRESSFEHTLIHTCMPIGNCRHQCTKRTAQSFSYLEYVVMIMKEEFPHLDERVLRNFIQSNDLLDRSLEEVYEVISKSELLRPAHLSNS